MVAFSAASLIFLPTDGSTVLQNNKMGWVRPILLVWSYSYPNSIDSSWAFIPLTWYLIKICSAISIKKCDMFILSDYRTFWPKMKTGWGWPPWGYLQKRKTWLQCCRLWLILGQVASFHLWWRVKLVAYKPPKRWLIFEGKVISHQKGGFFSSEARHY